MVRLPAFWSLQLVLRRITLAVALVLIVLVCSAPWLAGVLHGGPRLMKLLQLFATDISLRRTALASAAGLAVTATVFFRPPGGYRRGKAKDSTPPPPMMAGA